MANKIMKTLTMNNVTYEIVDGFARDNLGNCISDIEELQNGIENKADNDHSHEMSEINGLDQSLAGKQPKGDYATKAEAKGYADAKDSAIDAAKNAADNAQNDLDDYKTSNNTAVDTVRTSVQSVSNLVGNTSVATQINNAVANKANKTHVHNISDVDGLQNALNNKEASGAASSALTSAKSYTDTKIAALINGAPTTLDTLGEIATAMGENVDVVSALEEAIGTKANASDLSSHTSNKSNPHGVTKSQIGLGNVENKSSATIRGELTKTNVTTALGYTPPTTDTTYSAATQSAQGLMSAADKIKLDGIATGANKTIVDSALSSSSTNPVQNKVVNNAITKLNDLVGNASVEEQISDAFDDAITGLSVSGKVITYTKGDGTTGTITTQDTNTDTKVTQTVTTSNAAYPLLLAPSGQTANKTTTTYFDSGVTLNPSTNTIEANISGNASTADAADSVIVQTLAAGTDLNNLTTDGYYGCAASATAQAFSNNPLSSAGTGIIVKVYSMGGFIYQEVYGAIAGGIYKRRKNGESWSEWIQMATIDDNVASATKLQTGRTLKVNLARTNASTAFNGTANVSDIGVSGTLPIANGGTGATTAAGALINLGISATTTELNYVDGVTSNIQTQLNNKADLDDIVIQQGVSTSTSYRPLLSADEILSSSTATPTSKSSDTTYKVSGVSVQPSTGTLFAKKFSGSGESLTSLNASNISSGTIAAARLPAATTSAQGAMSAADKTKLDGIATGANKTTVDTALSSTSTNPVQNKVVNTALSGKQATITGAATTIASSNLTASRALVSDTNGKVAVSAVTSTELGYLDGVTSAIQTQLNAKAGTAVATTSANGLMSSTDKTRVDDLYKRVTGYAVTSGTTSAYTATITGVTLTHGTMIALRFNAANAANATLNVNSLGAKPIYYKGAAITASRAPANAVMLLVYDTTQVSTGAWHCVYSYDANSTYTNAGLGQGYATCSTAAATVAKTASLSGYALTTGGIVSVKFTYDVPASATLNVNSKGAKAIYHKGAAITAGVIKAGDTATFIYSTQYHLISVDRDADGLTIDLTNATTGTAATINATTLGGVAASEYATHDDVSTAITNALNAIQNASGVSF